MFSSTNIKHWIGVVEDKQDPEYRGRIRVRVFGVHTDKTQRDESAGEGIPTDELPWALTSLPLTFGGVSGNGTCPPPAVCVGAWVHGITLDGDFANQLLVLGVLPNKTNIEPQASNIPGASDGMLTGSSGETGAMGSLNFDAPDTKLCDNLTFRQLRDGVIFTESSNGRVLQNRTSSALGVMQVLNGTAAYSLEMLLKSDSGVKKLEEVGFVPDSATISAIKKAGGSTSYSDPKYQEYKRQMLTNHEFGALVGTNYLQYCLNRQGGDPVLGTLSYFLGEGTVNKGLKAFGGNRGNLPANVSYEEFLNYMNRYVPGENATAVAYINRTIGKNGAGVGTLKDLKNCRGSNGSGHGTGEGASSSSAASTTTT